MKHVLTHAARRRQFQMHLFVQSLSFLFIICFAACNSSAPVYKDASAPIEERVADLVSRMTIEEKAAQMDMLDGTKFLKDAATLDEGRTAHFIDSLCIGSIHDLYPESAAVSNQIQRRAMENSRLGIPVLFIEEGLHGYCGEGATNFPVPIGSASAWDTTLMYRIGQAIATEARAHGIHFMLNPNLDLAREPRWGRTEETYGEDVYLNSRMAVNMIKGMQGDDLKANNAVAAEPKHFGVHGIPESGSNTGSVFIGEREARSTHLYIFEKAVREAKARGIMAAYHDLDGIPCIANEWLLTGVLRNEWGFNGMVVTDLGAVKRLLDPHYTAANPKEAVTQAVNAGLNMQFYDFDPKTFQTAVIEAVKEGAISQQTLDKAVADILRVKFELGLFDNPYTDETLVSKVFHNEAHKSLALEAGRKSIILLKNENNTLPLNKGIRKIALLGEIAHLSSIGGYGPRNAKGVTVYEALKSRYGDKITQSVGEADAVVVVTGETDREVGEGKDRQNLNLKQADIDMIQAAAKSGKPVISVLLNGRPLVFAPITENSDAVLEAWFPGEDGGNAIVDVLFGDHNPSGKLTISIPKYQGQLPVYYSRKPASPRSYTDGNGEPLYSFGHGLSYSSFEYANLKITPEAPSANDVITVSLDVKNTSGVDGTETVQLYVRDKIASVATPIKALKGFSQVFLKAGETKRVEMKIIPQEHLWLINRDMERVVEPGEFDFMAGSSSVDIRMQQTVVLK